MKLPPVGVEPTTLTITGLEIRCLSNWANQTFLKLLEHDFKKVSKMQTIIWLNATKQGEIFCLYSVHGRNKLKATPTLQSSNFRMKSA